MTTTVNHADVLELRNAYSQARAAIENLSDPLEKGIGLATLRLESTQTFKQLVTTAPEVSRALLDPLEEYASNVVGGEDQERWVRTIDEQAQKAANTMLAQLTSMISGTAATGLLTTIIGIITLIWASGEHAGADFAAALLAGTVPIAILARSVYYAWQGVQTTWLKTTSWADSVGRQSDAAMETARDRQRSLLRAATGTSWVPEAFTEKARSRATGVVTFAWGLLFLGGALFGLAFILGCTQVLQATTTTSPPV
jgi:hypothetical protein